MLGEKADEGKMVLDFLFVFVNKKVRRVKHAL